jgi:NADH:ubiquinone reductase (non-electrogenic)
MRRLAATALIPLILPTLIPKVEAFAPLATSTKNKNGILFMSTDSHSSSGSQNTNEESIIDEEDHIVILGGGFGGLNTALTLDSLFASSPSASSSSPPKITLIDKKERFVFLPLLYELCIGDAELEEVAPTFKSLLSNTNIEFLQTDIQGIDIDNKIVHTTDKRIKQLPYESLVVATVADINLCSISGAADYALPFYTVEECFELRKRLTLIDSLVRSGEWNNSGTSTDENSDANVVKVVIVGGGYSGVELALNLKERMNYGEHVKVQITMLHRGDEVLQYASEFNRKTGQDRLEKAGVEILTGRSVVEVLPPDDDDDDDENNSCLRGRCRVVASTTGTKNADENSSTNMETLDADILLWTAGAMSRNEQRGILNSKLPRDSSGRIVTNKFLKVKGVDNVLALGDCARTRQVPYGATAAVAMQQAPVVAWNVYASTRKEKQRTQQYAGQEEKLEALPFEYINLGEMLTLGGDDASISTLDGLFQLNGAGASILRRLIYAVRMPTAQQALTAALSSTNKRFEMKKVQKTINWK